MPAPEPASAPTTRPARWKRWLAPGAALVLALVAAVTLWGKIRDDVWAYFTDGESLRLDAGDEKARPVLWQDPETTSLGGDPDANAPGAPLEAAFSADGTTMILVRADKQANQTDLYQSGWDGRVWSKPEPLASVNSPAHERGPALSADGRFLYFSSDRKGGLGGDDLYVARRNGNQWSKVEALPATVNSTANERGPAPSQNGDRLFFSSDRNDNDGEDIFVSALTEAKPIPKFADAEPVDTLNSKAADVQAALTARGDHVFLASDRDRNGDRGFQLYLSRVVDGQARPPQEVDLYFDKGDVTDPALRMDGFDLLFSARADTSNDPESGYALFHSTTREVVAYTDLSRWDQFKELMDNIAWRLLLAIAAFLALVYLLEKWQDITSLFHKCLAGSAALHLLALLLAMLWFVAREIEEDAPGKIEEIIVNIDALAQEELALESVPQETELTDTNTTVESEKVEAEFGAPGFEAQEENQIVPVAAATPKETVVVEVRPEMSEPVEQPVPEPMEPSSLLNDLAATALPEIDQPKLEERDPSEAQPAADPTEDMFEPEQPVREVAKVEPQPMAEAAVETPVDPSKVSEVQPDEALADQPKASEFVETTPAESTLVEDPAETPPLDSAMLAALPEAAFVDPNEMTLETNDPANTATNAPADPARDLFEPGEASASVSTSQADVGALSDSAVADSAGAAAVQSDTAIGSAPAMGATTPATSQANPTESLPTTDFAAATPLSLPDLALVDPGQPLLEEPAAPAAGAPADSSMDVFQPSPAAASLATSQAENRDLKEAAVTAPADATIVPTGDIPSVSAVTAPEIAPTPNESVLPSTAIAPSSTPLPELALVDPGMPRLEAPENAPAPTPANPAKDQFEPTGAVPTLVTTQATKSVVADSAVTSPSDTAVPTGAMTRNSALTDNRPPELTAPTPDTPSLNLVSVTTLPASALVDPGSAKLETPENSAAPADTTKDAFEPTRNVPNLATAPVQGSALPETAASRPVENGAVADATPDLSSAAPMARTDLAAAGSLPNLDVGAPLPDLAPTGLLPTPAKEKLEDPRGLNPRAMADLIQKQRGKPGIETIKQMGGTEGTEAGIAAAMEWLSKNQEADGRWDTQKHGARGAHDLGGTGLALLCYYGWGERHDQACKYQQHVRKALDWLLSQQKEDGYLGGHGGMMYSHAIATIALGEAYGVTKDPRLKEPAERALAYTLAAQSKSKGGWRYSPGEDSDLSVTGWQYMALHSARMAGLEVPEDAFTRARGYLDKMGGGQHGGIYGYQDRSQASKAMIATGMFCRQLDLVPPGEPRMQESARFLKMTPMSTTNPDYYYVYYATLALYQHQGEIWQDWNAKLQEILPLIQKKGGNEAGSWDASSAITSEGGRVVSTALATLSLEVYYRLLPMYGFRNTDAEAPAAAQREN